MKETKNKLFTIFDMKYKIQDFLIGFIVVLVIFLPGYIYYGNLSSFPLLIWGILLFYTLLDFINFNKAAKLLSPDKINRVYDEYQNPILELKHTYVLTENYLIKQYEAPAIIDIDKIVLVDYKMKSYQREIVDFLVIYTLDQKKYEISMRIDRKGFYISGFFAPCDDRLEKELISRNILFEKNKHNIELIKDKYGIDITKSKKCNYKCLF